MSTFLARVGAGLAASAVLIAPIAGAQLATAQNAGGGDLPVAGVLPDANITSDLTVHKLVGAYTQNQGDGQALPVNPDGTSPLAGVTFEVQKVNVDLTKAEGWREAQAMTPERAADNLTGEAKSQVTGEDGTTVFQDMPLGMYLVTETNAPNGVSMGAPFLVYLPMTQSVNGVQSWNRDVHVYPKNSQVSVEKTVDDDNQQAGDTINYTITGTVPQNMAEALDRGRPVEDNGSTSVKFEFHDFLDAENAYVGADQAIKLTIVGGDNDGQELVADEDYFIEGNDATADQPGSLVGPNNSQHIAVYLSSSGLNKIRNAKQVVMNMEAVLKPTAGTDGITYNYVRGVVNDGRGGGDVVVSNIPGDTPEDPDTPPTDPVPGVKTYLGVLNLLKQDGNDNSKKLAGAEFQLYASETAGLDSVDKVTDQGKLVTVGGVNKWTTDDQGRIVIDGLHASDFTNNGTDESPVNYYLIETKAPDGYVRLDTVTPFTINVGDQSGDTAITATATVDNYTDDNFLPFTGGAGMLGLLLAGAGAAGIGVAANRKKNKDAESEAEEA